MIDRLATDMYFYFKLYNLAILLYLKYTFLKYAKISNESYDINNQKQIITSWNLISLK